MWQPTHIQVTIQRAKDLIVKGKNGTNDCFVVIGLGKEKFQTSVKEKSRPNVEWQEECELTIPKQGNTAEVKLTVFHRNFLGVDEFLGQTLIPLSDFDTYERSKNRWYQLHSKPEKKDTKQRGSLEVRVAFTVKAASSASDANLSGNSAKHHSSMSNVVSLGGSIAGLNRKRMKSVKKIASAVGSKLSLNRRGSVSRGGGVDCDVESDVWGDDASSNADPGVISEGEEGEFGFDDQCRRPKASEFSRTASGHRSGAGGISLGGAICDETPLSSLSSSLQSVLSDRVESPTPPAATAVSTPSQVTQSPHSTTSLQPPSTADDPVTGAGGFDRSSPLRCAGESLRRRSSLSPVTKRYSDSSSQQLPTSFSRTIAESPLKPDDLDSVAAGSKVSLTVESEESQYLRGAVDIPTGGPSVVNTQKSESQTDSAAAVKDASFMPEVRVVGVSSEPITNMATVPDISANVKTPLQSEVVSSQSASPSVDSEADCTPTLAGVSEIPAPDVKHTGLDSVTSRTGVAKSAETRSSPVQKFFSKSVRNSRERFQRRKPQLVRNESSPSAPFQQPGEASTVDDTARRPLSDLDGASSPGMVSSVSLMTLSNSSGSSSSTACLRVVEGGNERSSVHAVDSSSRLSAGVRRRFDTMSREDLIEHVLQLQEQLNTSQHELAQQKAETADMKEYLDRLLVRVMEQQPDLLQSTLHRLSASNKYLSRVL